MAGVTASKTAEYVALYRALETLEGQPFFRDPFAEAFLSPDLKGALWLTRISPLRHALERYADWRAPGARSSAIGRTCYIDDVVRRATAEGVAQVVVLGAGYDCRAHRMPELRECRVFEVDRRDTQSLKRRRLGAQARSTRSNVSYVAVDFTIDSLEERLVAAGWKAREPSLFVWEGVTNYLNREAVAQVLSFVGRTAPGGLLVFTYVHRGVIDGSVSFDGGDKLVRNVERLGEPWTFGLEPGEVEEFLAGFGLTLEEDLGADAYRQRYFTSRATSLRGYAFYRIALARVGQAPSASSRCYALNSAGGDD
jgi:methyltransferase (TIGR00027 family)